MADKDYNFEIHEAHYSNIIKPMKKRFAIIGSRQWNDYSIFCKALNQIFKKCSSYHDLELCSGGAKGADTMAESYAKEHNIKITVFKPDIEKYGSPKAFHIRNKQIEKHADFVVAFIKGESKGTQSCLKLFTKKYTYLVVYEDEFSNNVTYQKLEDAGLVYDYNCQVLLYSSKKEGTE